MEQRASAAALWLVFVVGRVPPRRLRNGVQRTETPDEGTAGPDFKRAVSAMAIRRRAALSNGQGLNCEADGLPGRSLRARSLASLLMRAFVRSLLFRRMRVLSQVLPHWHRRRSTRIPCVEPMRAE